MSDRSQSSTMAEAPVAVVSDELASLPDQKGHDSPQDEKKPSEPSGPHKRSKLQSITIVAACTGTMILNVSSVTSINMAIPKIAGDLRMPSSQVPWIVSAFALSSGCMLMLFGRLADLYGRKLVWLLGALWIVVMSLGCSFSKTGVQMIVLRGLTGMGPAAMVPAAIGILAHSFPPSRARSTAFATFSAGAPMGGAIGQVFGGVMAEYATWRGVFWFMSGLGAAVFLAGLAAIDPDVRDPNSDRRVDWIGAALVTIGLVFVTYALSDAPTTGWSTPLILSLLIIGVIMLAGFLVWEHYLTSRTTFPPLMSLDIWTRAKGRFAAMQVVAFVAWACFTTLTFWATLYYQNYVKLSPIHTVLRFLPMPVTGVICNVIVALLVGRINGAYLLAVGTTSTGLSALLFAIIVPSAPFWQYGFPAAIMSVLGADFIFACGTLFIARVALPHEQSVAGALFNTVQALGTSLGLAITTIAQVAGMKAEARRMGVTLADTAVVSEIPPEALLKGYRVAQYTSFAFGMLALTIVVVFLHGIGVVGAKKKQVTGTEEAQPIETSKLDEKNDGKEAQ